MKPTSGPVAALPRVSCEGPAAIMRRVFCAFVMSHAESCTGSTAPRSVLICGPPLPTPCPHVSAAAAAFPRYEIKRSLEVLLGGIEVDTIDGFQGQEKDVIIFSCVRSGKEVGFLREPKRLNVALTRAKHGLYIIGKVNTLKRDPL